MVLLSRELVFRKAAFSTIAPQSISDKAKQSKREAFIDIHKFIGFHCSTGPPPCHSKLRAAIDGVCTGSRDVHCVKLGSNIRHLDPNSLSSSEL